VANYTTFDLDGLIKAQQKVMQARAESDSKFMNELQEIQFEIDKKLALVRLGPVGDAELAVLDDLKAARLVDKEEE